MKSKRAILEWIFEAIAFAALLDMIQLIATNWAILPDRMPTHFGASGTPNGWGSKNILWVLLFTNIAAYILMTLASRYQRLIHLPFRVDRDAPAVQQLLRRMTIVLKAVMMFLLDFITRGMINSAFGRTEGLGPEFLPIFMVATFLPLILFLSKLRKFQN